MKKKWKEMNGKEKALAVVYLLIAVVALVFAVIDFAEIWVYAHMCWIFAFAALCAIDCVVEWNNKRKIAIFELVCAVLMLAFGLVSFFI